MRAYIGVGGNLDDPIRQALAALAALAALPQTRLTARSPLYRSAPLGPPGQPDYINAVAALDTMLPPLELLTALQTLENRQGRTRAERWGPRTLDLDILLYGDVVLDHPRLQIPHPRLPERAFVLYPLRAIAPDLRLPDGRDLDALLRCCPPWTLERLDESSEGDFRLSGESPRATIAVGELSCM